MARQGNAVFAQSGGPTTVINASLQGALEEAAKHSEIVSLYGAVNGILGVLQEELADLRQEPVEELARLRRSPAAALGSCRYKVKKEEDVERICRVFQAHNIRYFFYAGGNDSMDTADRVNKLAARENYELHVLGIPKTIDNDLALTDHSPGYGSVAKYLATTVMESGRDTDALYTHDTSTVLEAMGRNTGWIAAATSLARRTPEEAPHLIYVPEVPVALAKLVEDVRAVYKELGRVFIVAAEGMLDENREYYAEAGGKFAQDAFGHRQLGGAAEVVRQIVESEVGIKCRSNKPGTAQRNAMHFASKTDVEEAYLCGAAAAREAVAGRSGFMITLLRKSSRPYRVETGTAPLSEVANGVKPLPREWVNEAGNFLRQEFKDYALPLIQGQAELEIDRDGLPRFARLKRVLVARKLAEWKA